MSSSFLNSGTLIVIVIPCTQLANYGLWGCMDCRFSFWPFARPDVEWAKKKECPCSTYSPADPKIESEDTKKMSKSQQLIDTRNALFTTFTFWFHFLDLLRRRSPWRQWRRCPWFRIRRGGADNRGGGYGYPRGFYKGRGRPWWTSPMEKSGKRTECVNFC